MSLFRGLLGLGLEPGNQLFLRRALAERVLVRPGSVMLIVTRDLAAFLGGALCLVVHGFALSALRPDQGNSDVALAAKPVPDQAGTV